MDNICKICGKSIDERVHFYKNHKIKEKDYYEKYYPKYDLLTKEVIPFISIDSYFNKNFVNKNNLKKYLESVDKNVALQYCKDWLFEYAMDKKLLFQLGEFECRTLNFPSISYIEKKFGEGAYESISSNATLRLKYNYKSKIEFDNKELEITCDTREQNLLSFKNIQIAKLDYGDYACGESKINIERKSLIDAVGTLSKGYERFDREITRCEKDSGYLIVVIEENYNHLLSFSYLPHMKKVRASEAFILHRIRGLMRAHPNNLQFLCVDGRTESSRVIEKIFNMKSNVRTVDLQWAYNNKLI